jgi:hypothetical protein
MRSVDELDNSKSRWSLIFKVSVAVLLLCLLDIAVFLTAWPGDLVCYTVGAISSLVAIYAARKLRDIERFYAAADGSWLNRRSNHSGGLDDDD